MGIITTQAVKSFTIFLNNHFFYCSYRNYYNSGRKVVCYFSEQLLFYCLSVYYFNFSSIFPGEIAHLSGDLSRISNFPIIFCISLSCFVYFAIFYTFLSYFIFLCHILYCSCQNPGICMPVITVRCFHSYQQFPNLWYLWF